MFLSKKPQFPPMPTNGLFKLIRQPIYLSFCIVLWSPPTLNLDLFCVALFYSLIVIFPILRKIHKFYGNVFKI